MRILLLNEGLPPESIGGSARVVYEVAVSLAARGHEVHVLTPSVHSAWPVVLPGITVHTIPKLPVRWAHFRSVFSRKRAAEIVRIIDAVQPDILHAHGIAWQIGYRWIDAALARGIPCFYTGHGMMTIAYGKITGTETLLLWNDLKRARWTYNPLRNLLIRRRLNRLRTIFCVSDALREVFVRYGFAHVETLHNGVNVDVWQSAETQAEARIALGLPLDVPLFLLAGRLGHDKGLQLLLSLWPRLKGVAHLILAGQVPPTPGLDSPLIHILPKQSAEGMRQLYRAVDVNLVPSLCFDCFPTTSIESQAMGTPVLVTSRGGGREAVIEGQTGWGIDPANPDALLDRIQWCIDHRADLPAIGQRAAGHMRTHFSLERHTDLLLGFYTAALVS